MNALTGKTVFISGGSRGIGLAIAKACGGAGANVVIAAKTDKPHPIRYTLQLIRRSLNSAVLMRSSITRVRSV